MKNSQGKGKRFGLLITSIALCASAALLLLASVRAHPVATSLNVVNNSNWQINHLYLSAVNDDNWSGDQLNGRVLSTGDSFALDNVACDSTQIKVISENTDGCFLSQTVTCGGNATWTITNAATPDCGN